MHLPIRARLGIEKLRVVEARDSGAEVSSEDDNMAGEEPPRYAYYDRLETGTGPVDRKHEAARKLGEQRLNPGLREPDYLVLRERVRHLRDWASRLPGRNLRILDVGGRIQPYRTLFEGRIGLYVGTDLQFEGIVDVVARAERLPFASDTFDVVLCTQVLSYVGDPQSVVTEAHRVLRPGGVLLLTAPAFFPRHHDERWRFLPEGLELLLSAFGRREIRPEGFSIAGICRTINVGLTLHCRNRLARRVLDVAIVPCMNLAGRSLDGLSRGATTFTANYSVAATK